MYYKENKKDYTQRVFGIIGNPIGHSLSPVMHNIISRESGVHALYVPFCVKSSLEAAINGAYSLGIRGLNITLPYKKEVLKYIHDIDSGAYALGAVNTLVYGEKGYKGYNTDFYGLKKSVIDHSINIEDQHVIILGTGGAARAAAHVAISLKAESITISGRNAGHAVLLKEELKNYIKNTGTYVKTYINSCSMELMQKETRSYDDKDSNGYIVFQTTPVGMYPDINGCIVEDKGFYKKCKAGIELVYNPLKTRFIISMEESGKTAVNGLDMLINQGILSWELWNDGMTVNSYIRKKIKLELEKLLNN